MHAAIINNGSTEPTNILRLLEGNEVVVFSYADAKKANADDFDLLVLSGGSQFPIEYNKEKLRDEIALIRRSSIPTLGICYGCELIAIAFGGTLTDRGDKTQGRTALRVEVVKNNPIFQGKKEFLVYDAHRWVIDQVPTDFEVLARSVHGVEVIKHKTRPIYGFQFHPEKMLDETFGDELFAAFIKQEVPTMAEA